MKICYTENKEGVLPVKKRLLALILLAALILCLLPGAHGLSPLCFVADNDSVPLVLSGGENPFYSGGKLYIPYNSFDASPNGVGASYNTEKNTLVLFNSSQTLIFDLKNKTYTDSQDKSYDVELVYRGGTLYVPANVASRFGLSVTLLFSRYGYSIIRFTNGEQVYDDGTFVAQAENLIDRAVTEYERNSSFYQQNSGGLSDLPLDETKTPVNPVHVYMAFVSEAVSQETLDMLTAMSANGAFFLTEEQILSNKELVRAIYAAGHTIGLTVAPGEPDVADALKRANDALDLVLFHRSVFVLLPYGTNLQTKSYCVLPEPSAKTAEEVLRASQGQHLFVVRSNAPGVIADFVEGGAALHLLLETSF